jgi:hypothetical protein
MNNLKLEIMPVDPKPTNPPPTPKALVINDLSKENKIIRTLAWIIKKLM